MLVIHDTETAVRDLLSYLPNNADKVEIACYNSKTSHVLVGSSSAIASIKQVIKEVSKFSTLKSSNADTSHGFHSYLTDGLLAEIDEGSKKHTFSARQISLEACTLQQSGSTSSERISRHF
jgi:acyl transferase domain-containing protein